VNSKNLAYITFVIQDVEGGVASMNHQIIENADFRRFYFVHIILWRSVEQKSRKFGEKFLNADQVSMFQFSQLDNYYRTLKKFNRVLNEFPGFVVTNDGIELEAIKKFGTQSILYSIVHDFYNLRLAFDNLRLVDYFICHNEVFSKVLLSSPSMRGRVGFILHGVKLNGGEERGVVNDRAKLVIISISRWTESKGVLLLIEIDRQLKKKGVEVDWKIIGSGELEPVLKDQWKDNHNSEFFSPDSLDEVYRIAETGDIFISPSSFEGYGIALLEAMSCGLVPVISKLSVGIYSELPGDVGFTVESGDLNGYTDSIEILEKDRTLLNKMSEKAKKLVKDRYDISKTSKNYLEYFTKHTVSQTGNPGNYKKSSGFGLLDNAIIPNAVTRLIKKYKKMYL
jgi:glycosyltransferase involved in cell wall biosynthesis